jgi:hypothetical protein
MACELVGVAGFEPAASSSRSQVVVWTTSTAACLSWDRSSVSIRWRPPMSVPIVTHLVTRGSARPRCDRLDANYKRVLGRDGLGR